MMGTEHQEQVALFEWAAWKAKEDYPELDLMFAIPNGGLRNKVVAGKLKAEGVKSGVPDILLPIRRYKFFREIGEMSDLLFHYKKEMFGMDDPIDKRMYNGLFIEMKVGKNKLTDSQWDWCEQLVDKGYLVAVCYGADEAKKVLEWYLGDVDKG